MVIPANAMVQARPSIACSAPNMAPCSISGVSLWKAKLTITFKPAQAREITATRTRTANTGILFVNEINIAANGPMSPIISIANESFILLNNTGANTGPTRLPSPIAATKTPVPSSPRPNFRDSGVSRGITAAHNIVE